ncbi:glycerophosphodiester phosphodiesterase family protein [Novosphingobium percolationis]|uniref:glycerophosphodiester phosphodiesterase family protein n=1 Tax=Novosphingobium percolationis TaxID=2871811 RepID=UPI001CD298CC|nr:glycerophosphodiester phosphodiesterase family protein [Novosphingobium percolationis]MCH7627625.1 glycerophosphodiester phosphodiesterase [Pseudomonadota bacterium]
MTLTVSRREILAGTAAFALCGMAAPQRRPRVMQPTPPQALVFGHRGACALRPEHTLESYARAIADGADYVEPDLVPTKDGVLVARHEPNIAETTNVADHPEFADRRKVKQIDGESQQGWFTEDFTLAELKTLRAKERLGALRPESQSFDGKLEIVTFDEIVAFVQAEGIKAKREVGLIPEIKHSTYFAAQGFDMEGLFLAAYKRLPYLQDAPLIVQSFETACLRRLRAEIGQEGNVQLMQLYDEDAKRPADVVAARGKLTYGDMATPKGFFVVADYADWVCPPKDRIYAMLEEGRRPLRSAFLADAHRAQLLVACYTFRPENPFLPPNLRRGDENERNQRGMVDHLRLFLNAGIDGFFTDDPAMGRLAETDWGL